MNNLYSIKPKGFKTFLVTGMLALMAACNTLKTAPYDHYSFQKAVEIKVEAIHLLDNATEPFSEHREEVGNLLLELDKILLYEEHKPNNSITYEMWKLLANKDKNLLMGLLNRWEQKGKLDRIFLNEAQLQITEAIDMIVRYEAKKNKENENNLLELILTNQ